jgi:hypothetical protein
MAVENRKHDVVVESLLIEPTIERAAEVSGVSTRTIRRWLRENADFIASYRAARRQIFEAAVGRLVSLCAKAVEQIEVILNDPQAPASVKLRTAQLVLEQVRAAQADDIEERLQQIEGQVERMTDATVSQAY